MELIYNQMKTFDCILLLVCVKWLLQWQTQTMISTLEWSKRARYKLFCHLLFRSETFQLLHVTEERLSSFSSPSTSLLESPGFVFSLTATCSVKTPSFSPIPPPLLHFIWRLLRSSKQLVLYLPWSRINCTLAQQCNYSAWQQSYLMRWRHFLAAAISRVHSSEDDMLDECIVK